jgi:hypothetical protein
MRILLARFANDKYFASLRSAKARAMGLTEQRIDDGCFAYEDDAKGFSTADKCALRYAELMFLDAGQLDKPFYDEMKKHWSEAQIMELGAFIAFHYGMQMFMRSLGAVPLDCDPETNRSPGHGGRHAGRIILSQCGNFQSGSDAMGQERPIRGVGATSALHRRVQPVDATLYLRGKKMELGR